MANEFVYPCCLRTVDEGHSEWCLADNSIVCGACGYAVRRGSDGEGETEMHEHLMTHTRELDAKAGK